MGLSRNPNKALEIYYGIPDKSMKVNVSVCNSILGCVMANGRFDSSLKLFELMKDDGLSPDLVTYSTVQFIKIQLFIYAGTCLVLYYCLPVN